MVQDELACDRIESWGEWNFMAKGVPVEKESYEGLEYDVVSVDLENRRIQADIIGYDQELKDVVQDAVRGLENEYGYLVSNVSDRMTAEENFPPKNLDGEVFWEEDEAWMLNTSEFQTVSEGLFGYDVLSRGYEQITAERC